MKNGHEEWRDIPGYEGSYQASSLGRIRSLDRIGAAGQQLKGRVLTLWADKKGYKRVSMSWRCRKKTQIVHRLVLESFIGPCPPGMEACHWDGNPRNNRLSNLRWDTRDANALDKRRHGTAAYGEAIPWARLTEADIFRIFEMRAGGATQREIADTFGIGRESVVDILSRKNWAHVPVPSKLIERANRVRPDRAGAKNPNSLLTESDVLAIYDMRRKGHTYREIAESFGIAKSTISLILTGRNWAHLYHRYRNAQA